MKPKTMKSKLGHWLSIEELRGFLVDTPDEIHRTVPINSKLLEIASEFVEEKRGLWEHPDWESFLDKLNKEGFSLKEEVKAPIGNILEIFKSYYHRGDFQTILEKRERAPHVQQQVKDKKDRAVKSSEVEKSA